MSKSDEVLEFEVSGERIQAVRMLPGYTHNIINLSETENLVTLMWATGAMAFGTTPQSSFSCRKML